MADNTTRHIRDYIPHCINCKLIRRKVTYLDINNIYISTSTKQCFYKFENICEKGGI